MVSPKQHLRIVAVAVCAAFIFSACGSAQEGPAEVTIEAQTVVEATATPQPTFTPMPTATVRPTQTQTSADLPTELIEPESPISPVATMENSSTQTLPPGSEDAVNAAIADLAQQNGIAADSITIVSVESMDWPDSSLGCPQEGFMYAQVITPGYLVILAAQGQEYEYHTDQTGKSVVLCNNQ